jgi:hypothetical protein
VIFTKFDGLITTVYNQLRMKLGLKEAKKQAAEDAEQHYLDNFVKPLTETQFKPATYLQLKGRPIVFLCHYTTDVLVPQTCTRRQQAVLI